MNQNNDNSKTVVFTPLKEEEEKIKKIPDSKDFGEVYYYDDAAEETEDDEDKTGGNGILIGLVIVLVILFIAAIIWGTAVLNKINKEEEEKNSSQQVVQEQPEEEEAPVEEPAQTEGEKLVCEIFFKSESVEEEEYGYTVRAIFTDENGEYYTKRLTIDEDTVVREDGDRLSFKSFVLIIESLDDKDIEFEGTIDNASWHVDSISYKREMLGEDEEEGIVLEESFGKETEEEGTEVTPE